MIVSDTAVRNRTTVFVLLAIIVLAGMYCYLSLPRESFPDVTIPTVLVTTPYRGVAPEDMEKSVTIEIEKKLKGLDGVDKITSVSSEGSSFISITFLTDRDIDDALEDVRNKVDEAKAELPTDLDADPMVMEINTSDFPIIVLALSGDVGLKRLRDIADDLQDDIEGISGVLEAEISGGLEREIHVEVSPERMALYGLPFSTLEQIISSENVNSSGGYVRTEEGKYQLRVEGEFETIEEVERIIIATLEGTPVYLRDVARVVDGVKDQHSASRYNGRDAVTIMVKKRSGENIIRISDELRVLLDEKRATFPPGVAVAELHNMADDIDEMIADLENNIITGFLLVILIVSLAMGLRNAFIVSTSIPLSMLLGFIVLNAFDVTLNMVVLFSLTLALGMLVDNAIVIIENIYRFMQEGVPRLEAAMRATAEVAYPIIGSALTTIGAFFPLLWWTGLMGEFMSYLPMTVIVVLASCLFVALVINPALASVFMKAKSDGSVRSADDVTSGTDHPMLHGGGIFIRTYRAFLRSAIGAAPRSDDAEDAPGGKKGVLGFLDRLAARIPESWVRFAPRVCVVVIAVLLFRAGILFWLYRVGLQTPGEFFPSTDPDVVDISMEMPEGADLAYCDAVAKEVEMHVFSGDFRSASTPLPPYDRIAGMREHVDILGATYTGPSDMANIENISTNVTSQAGGGSMFEQGSANGVSVRMIDLRRRKRKSQETQQDLIERCALVPGAEIRVEEQRKGPPTGAPVNIEILGDDFETLGRLGKRACELVRRVPFTRNVKDDYSAGAPTLEVRVDRKRAALLGLTTGGIGYALKAAFNGLEVSTYREGDEDYDIIVRFEDADRHTSETLKRFFIPTVRSGLVPLTTVASVVYRGGLGEVRRIDHDRAVTVSADVDEIRTTGDTARRQAKALLSGDPLFEEGATFAEGSGATTVAAALAELLADDAFAPVRKALADNEIIEKTVRAQAGEKAWTALTSGSPEALRDALLGETDDRDARSNRVRMLLNTVIERLDLPVEERAALAEAHLGGENAPAGMSTDAATLARLSVTDGKARMKLNRLLLGRMLDGMLLAYEPGLDLPQGYSYRFTGEQEEQDNAKNFLNVAGAVALAIIFLVLVAQFNSVLYPFIIMVSVVLSIAGVFLGLGLYRLPFGVIMTGVGVISLAGVVVNNAIVLIDYTILLRDRGLSTEDAVVAAGCTRLRPVILTAVTTVLGLVPMATGLSIDFHPLLELSAPMVQTASESSQWWKNMAVSVIFGLWVATLMTLVVVPVLFASITEIREGFTPMLRYWRSLYWRAFRRLTGIAPRPGDPDRPGESADGNEAEAG